jgi:hypothetical protein
MIVTSGTICTTVSKATVCAFIRTLVQKFCSRDASLLSIACAEQRIVGMFSGNLKPVAGLLSYFDLCRCGSPVQHNLAKVGKFGRHLRTPVDDDLCNV